MKVNWVWEHHQTSKINPTFFWLALAGLFGFASILLLWYQDDWLFHHGGNNLALLHLRTGFFFDLFLGRVSGQGFLERQGYGAGVGCGHRQGLHAGQEQAAKGAVRDALALQLSQSVGALPHHCKHVKPLLGWG